MGAIDDKPGARPGVDEQLGVAWNTSSLTTELGHDWALQRVAAVGGACAVIAENADGPGCESSDEQDVPRSVDRDRIEARLAPLLWRLKFASDATPLTALDAVHLFVQWMALQSYWRRHRAHVEDAVLRLFAARVLYEWLADRCPACGGTGVQELLRGGATRRPRAFGDPNVRHVTCRGCGGSRRPRYRSGERAQALGISLALFEAHWPRRFAMATSWLASIARRLKKPLHAQLG